MSGEKEKRRRDCKAIPQFSSLNPKAFLLFLREEKGWTEKKRDEDYM